MDRNGPEVGIGPEQLSEGEQAGLRASLPLGGGQGRVAHRTQQHGVGVPDPFPGAGGQRRSGLRHPRRADCVFREVESVAEQVRHGPENPHGLGRDLRPDPVTRQDGEGVATHEASPRSSAARRRSNAAILDSRARVRPISSSPRSNISRR
jgi:hypothetical protein